jgi:hypothetical protein
MHRRAKLTGADAAEEKHVSVQLEKGLAHILETAESVLAPEAYATLIAALAGELPQAEPAPKPLPGDGTDSGDASDTAEPT